MQILLNFQTFCCNLNIRGLAAKLCPNSFRNKNNRKYYFYFERNYDVLKSKSPCFLFKACARYFLSNSYLWSNDSSSKNMKNVFYFIEKALFVFEILYFPLPLFFSLSAFALEVDSRKILKFMTSSSF